MPQNFPLVDSLIVCVSVHCVVHCTCTYITLRALLAPCRIYTGPIYPLIAPLYPDQGTSSCGQY